MGEEAKQEEAPVEAKPKAEETETEETKTVEKKEEAPKPRTPIVLQVDFHCIGCAKKVERSIMRLKGVEGVVVDMGQNQLTIRGAVDPQAVCAKVAQKIKSARVLSPLPSPESDLAKPDVAVASEASAMATVELKVNMHCEACAAQLKRKIVKMRGVQTAETELSSGKVTVTGTMDAEKLVDYVYRRTKKQARIVPQLETPKPAPEEGKKAGEDANKEAATPAQPEENKVEDGKADDKTESSGGDDAAASEGDQKGEEGKEANKGEETAVTNPPAAMISSGFHNDDETMKQMMTYYYPPIYVIERIPPPQLFSDENPNACCIT